MNTQVLLAEGDFLAQVGSVRDGFYRLIFADPPYNLSGANHQTVRSGKRVRCDKGDWDVVADIHSFNRAWVAQCVRVLAADGTLWISGTLHNHPSIGCVLKELGMWVINDVVWYKRNAPPLLSANRLAPATEIIWVASKSKRYYFDYEGAKRLNGGKQMRNLWEINAARHVTSHPAEKPESLLDRIIRIGSREGDWVLDPFMGSGTTGVVAKRLGRNFHGFELDAGYFSEAKGRIAKAEAGTPAGAGRRKPVTSTGTRTPAG